MVIYQGLLALIAAVLLIPSLAGGESLPFPGGATFQFKIDEMTDKKACSVFTPMRGVQAAVYDSATVAFWVPEQQGVVARDPAPIMRIDEASSFRLVATEKPHMIGVPPPKAREVVEALYTRRKIAVRWYNFPHREQKNLTVETGDFGAAYDHAVKVCGWSRLNVKRRPLSKEPKVYKGDNGYISASFGGSLAWTVTFMPQFGSCEISAPGVHTVFSSSHGQPEAVLELGKIIFYDPNGQEVSRVVHKEYAPAPITAIIAAARKAGEYGTVELPYEKASLFGFLEAVEYAEKTCKVSVRSAVSTTPTVISPQVAPSPAISQPVIRPPVLILPKVTLETGKEVRLEAKAVKPAAVAPPAVETQDQSDAGQGIGVGRGTGVTLANTDPALAYYIVLIQDKIEGNWTPPKMNPGTTASVILSLRILRSGQVRDLAVDSSSGDRLLDDSVLRAVRLSTPLPPLPPLFKIEMLPMELRFTIVGKKG